MIRLNSFFKKLISWSHSIHLWQSFKETIEQEYDRWFLWAPVALATGIGIYFILPFEPWLWVGILAIGLSLPLFSLNRLLAYGLLWLALGFSIVQWRTHLLDTPMISQIMTKQTVTGTIDRVETREDDLRITISSLKTHSNLAKIRVILKDKKQAVAPGDIVTLNATLLPPPGPVMPGAHNFRRQAYFQGISAVGIAKSLNIVQHAKTSNLKRIQHQITKRIQQDIPGQSGAIAAALVTGDRSGISKAVRENFSTAGIAHILAISGLHLSIIAGFIFLLFRRGLSLFPQIALNHSTKKWAAIISIVITSLYLALCWGSVPAFRAYIMTTIMMLAILMDRPAISMRNVALAAIVILFIWPEALLGPSFQLSFSAVIGLVAAYESSEMMFLKIRSNNSLPRLIFAYLIGVVTTTLIAGAMTAPLAMHTFNHFSGYGPLANLVAIPLATFWIMPMAFLQVVLMPIANSIGISALLGYGIEILTKLAAYIAALPGATVPISATSNTFVILLVLGGLWIMLWQKTWRWAGLMPILIAGVVATTDDLPDILISRDGKQIARRGDNGTLYMIADRGGSFTKDAWMQRLGLTQVEPASEGCSKNVCTVKKNGRNIVIAKSAWVKLKYCSDIMVSMGKIPDGCTGPLIDKSFLKAAGASTITIDSAGQEKVLTVADSEGIRPWS
ncbi:MAG: ComEC/Rec2 family competence protein [Alphaproteobacteria bacterium]